MQMKTFFQEFSNSVQSFFYSTLWCLALRMNVSQKPNMKTTTLLFLSLFSFTTFVVVTCFRYFDGSPLSSAWHVTSTTSPVLLEYAVTLDLVEFSDSGLYECRPDKLDPVSVNLHVVKGKSKQSQWVKKQQKSELQVCGFF